MVYEESAPTSDTGCLEARNLSLLFPTAYDCLPNRSAIASQFARLASYFVLGTSYFALRQG